MRDNGDKKECALVAVALAVQECCRQNDISNMSYTTIKEILDYHYQEDWEECMDCDDLPELAPIKPLLQDPRVIPCIKSISNEECEESKIQVPGTDVGYFPKGFDKIHIPNRTDIYNNKFNIVINVELTENKYDEEEHGFVLEKQRKEDPETNSDLASFLDTTCSKCNEIKWFLHLPGSPRDPI